MVNVTFLHPDLGIGGAERLIVDAAVALKKHNHSVHIVTAHHSTDHCFPETANGEIPVTVVGDWIPRNIFGKCAALCAYIRMIYAALYVIFFADLKTDVAICDLISVCIPILRFRIKTVIFYCHFPDQLLSRPGNVIKQIYRYPLNSMEEKTTGLADVILVNSQFTKETFQKTFKSLKVSPDILYPSINTANLNEIDEHSDADILDFNPEKSIYLLSINRYERKKNMSLAIEALSCIRPNVNSETWANLKLVIAGGYDTLVKENIEYLKELKQITEDLNLSEKVIFIKSPTESEKIKLLKFCRCVVYTPANEHFGIVPLEAMYYEKPIIGVNSGGPTETIINEKTGFLCSDSDAFAEAMLKCVKDKELCIQLGKAARSRFDSCFSFEAFARKLNDIVVTRHAANI